MSKTETPKTDAPKTETRTDAPKAEAKTEAKTDAKASPFPGFPPFPGFAAFGAMPNLSDLPWPTAAAFEQFSAVARQNLDRLQTTLNSYWDEIAGYENAMYERAKAASQDMANLASESISYAAALTAEWRKLSVETTRKIADTFQQR